MQDASIPPKDNTYIVGYAGQIPLMKEKLGNTGGLYNNDKNNF